MSAAIAGICRFCGCTEKQPCISLQSYPGGVALGMPLGFLDSPMPATGYVCSWIDEDMDCCTSPACVEKAYREAVLHDVSGFALIPGTSEVAP